MQQYLTDGCSFSLYLALRQRSMQKCGPRLYGAERVLLDANVQAPTRKSASARIYFRFLHLLSHIQIVCLEHASPYKITLRPPKNPLNRLYIT
ncbi:hypothetical protein CY34DRAFT_808075 [Suillus luteus UH-Slu-Lm8-n1]|uniref:Uncharacterized protein n=1 Tax=Suillus luteus UH-Slu-Lm8-n1 TaxID=930992 RepID=A0A0C9ZPM0_9AGAM|nr:hypothetical protein CY34DRAFT_808075 [Suillus luteus UH-Slu-Lm8-n1]